MVQCIMLPAGQKSVHQLCTLQSTAEKICAVLGMSVPVLWQATAYHTNLSAKPVQLGALVARPQLPGQDSSSDWLLNNRRTITTTKSVAYDGMEEFMRLKRRAGAKSRTYSDQQFRQERHRVHDYGDTGWTLHLDNLVFEELKRTSHHRQHGDHSNYRSKDSNSHTTSRRTSPSQANRHDRQHGSKQFQTAEASTQGSSAGRSHTVHRGRNRRTYTRSRWSSRPFSREWWQQYDTQHSDSRKHHRQRTGSFYSYTDSAADSDDDDFDWEQWVQQHLNVKPQSQQHTSSSNGTQSSGRDRDWYRQYWEQPRWQDSTDSSSRGSASNSYAGSHWHSAYWWEHYKSSSAYGSSNGSSNSSGGSAAGSSGSYNTSSHHHTSGSATGYTMHTPVVIAHLAALGLGPTTSLCAVALKKAFHKCAMQWHPDRHTNSTAGGIQDSTAMDSKASQQHAAERFKAATAAYEALRALC